MLTTTSRECKTCLIYAFMEPSAADWQQSNGCGRYFARDRRRLVDRARIVRV